MNPVERNARRILTILVETPEERMKVHPSPGFGLLGFRAGDIQEWSGLPPQEVNDAVAHLLALGAVENHFPNHHDAGYSFRYVIVTSRGRFQYHEDKTAEESANEIARGDDMRQEGVLPLETTPADPAKVFVVHGRNEKARVALFQFLRAIGLKPIEWSEAIRATGNPAPYVGEILDAAFSMAQAVVVLMTPDDMAYLRQPLHGAKELPHEIEPTGQARPNVLFEAGMALGRHPRRTVLVELGELRPFSDVAGRHAVRIDNSSQKRHDLADRLELAGCPINLKDRDWHTAGDFHAALEGL